MRRDLLRRVAKLEAQLSFSEQRLRRLAAGLGIDPERLLEAAKGHEAELARQLGDNGTITWGGFLLVLKLLGIDPTRRTPSHRAQDPDAGARNNNAKIIQNDANNNASLTRPKRVGGTADSG